MKTFGKYIPFAVSAIICIIMFVMLLCKLCYQENFSNTLIASRESILTISGLLSGIIIAYLTAKVLQIRNERITKLPQINELTQKIHKFRRIINNLLLSELLPRDVRYRVDTTYNGLTFFDYREIIFVDSKPTLQAIKYSEDTACGGLENLYLELRAFVPKGHDFDESLYSEFEVSKFYSSRILENWIKYDCGNGLWYYFDNEYPIYRQNFNFNIYQGYKDEILECCSKIDKDRYHGMPFDAPLLAKLGSQISGDIIPKLFEVQMSIEKGLPKIINYLFIIFVLLVLFGVTMSLLSNIFNLNAICDVISVSVVLSVCIYIVTSFYGFMKHEIKL